MRSTSGRIFCERSNMPPKNSARGCRETGLPRALVTHSRSRQRWRSRRQVTPSNPFGCYHSGRTKTPLVFDADHDRCARASRRCEEYCCGLPASQRRTSHCGEFSWRQKGRADRWGAIDRCARLRNAIDSTRGENLWPTGNRYVTAAEEQLVSGDCADRSSRRTDGKQSF